MAEKNNKLNLLDCLANTDHKDKNYNAAIAKLPELAKDGNKLKVLADKITGDQKRFDGAQIFSIISRLSRIKGAPVGKVVQAIVDSYRERVKDISLDPDDTSAPIELDEQQPETPQTEQQKT